MDSFLPSATQGGVTTAVNATVASSSAELALQGGPEVLVSVGAYPIFIRFGMVGTTAVSSSNGLYLAANSTTIFSVPTSATHILHIRAVVNDSTISVQSGMVVD